MLWVGHRFRERGQGVVCCGVHRWGSLVINGSFCFWMLRARTWLWPLSALHSQGCVHPSTGLSQELFPTGRGKAPLVVTLDDASEVFLVKV